MKVDPVWNLSDLPHERLEEVACRAISELRGLRNEARLNLIVTSGVLGIFAGAGLSVLAFAFGASWR